METIAREIAHKEKAEAATAVAVKEGKDGKATRDRARATSEKGSDQKRKGKGKPQGPYCGCGGAHLQRNHPNARGYQVRSLDEPIPGGWFRCLQTIEPHPDCGQVEGDGHVEFVGKGRQR